MKMPESNKAHSDVQARLILGLSWVDFCIAAVLTAMIIFSALSVSFVSQNNRHLFSELEMLRKESTSLHSRWARLLLERSTLASNNRIEEIARNQLQLKSVTPQDTVIIK